MLLPCLIASFYCLDEAIVNKEEEDGCLEDIVIVPEIASANEKGVYQNLKLHSFCTAFWSNQALVQHRQLRLMMFPNKIVSN